MQSIWTRRQFLARMSKAGAGLTAMAGAGYGGYKWPRDTAPEPRPEPKSVPDPDVERFHTRPDLTPPNITTNRVHHDRTAVPRLYFITPKGYQGIGPGTQGPLIVDQHGQVVWFDPTPGEGGSPTGLEVQQYQGKPVLTWWKGTMDAGHGAGAGIIMDSAYRTIATVKAGNGQSADMHEFRLTDRGSALISAYRKTTADLTPIGGKKHAPTYSGIVQEIDVATGAVLFEWDSLDQVGIEETYTPATVKKGDAVDYFHINAIDVAPDGDLLVSARNTWSIYKISRKNGRIRWRLGGKKSDFSIASDARFQWQHDIRSRGENRISLFDNAASPQEAPQSRGLVLDIDEQARRVSLVHQYTHPARLLAHNQGSVQILDNGLVCVGWGGQPYFSVFTEDGRLVLDGRLPANETSYRALAFDWVGRPDTDPDITLGSNPAGGTIIYASWNGATEVATWQVLAGKAGGSLTPAARSARSGFDTAVVVNTEGPYFAVAALDRHEREIGRSKTVRS
ncbi:MAG TPA: arylsulfotransferase family protein [Mycobacteriales bacterium]|nr:arylsulfotransferase family protein [Mycobacteriales bacterium]